MRVAGVGFGKAVLLVAALVGAFTSGKSYGRSQVDPTETSMVFGDLGGLVEEDGADGGHSHDNGDEEKRTCPSFYRRNCGVPHVSTDFPGWFQKCCKSGGHPK